MGRRLVDVHEVGEPVLGRLLNELHEDPGHAGLLWPF
jgi:hypothetical protein